MGGTGAHEFMAPSPAGEPWYRSARPSPPGVFGSGAPTITSS